MALGAVSAAAGAMKASVPIDATKSAILYMQPTPKSEAYAPLS